MKEKRQAADFIPRTGCVRRARQGRGEPALYAGAVQNAVLPMWSHVLATSEDGYRIRSSSADADQAWSKIEAQLFDQKQDKAA